MIKKIKIGNKEIGVQATYHYDRHRIIGISFSRMVGLISPERVYYTFTINLWKYVFKIGVTKYND